MSKVPAKFIGLSTTIGIQQPIGTYGGQIYLQKWCQPMVFPDVLYWPINYYHRYLKTYRHLYCLQKWCQPMVEIVFPDDDCVALGPSSAVTVRRDGFSFEDGTDGTYWDDALSKEEIHIICGLYRCYTGMTPSCLINLVLILYSR